MKIELARMLDGSEETAGTSPQHGCPETRAGSGHSY